MSTKAAKTASLAEGEELETRKIVYDDDVVAKFILASVVFGIVGMLVGAIIALQLAFWPANVSPYLTFGRLRPLHTNAVIFAFVGNMIFAGIYYSTQRLMKARTNDLLSKIHFWGWQLIIVAAAVTLPLGFTQAKEYAELEWPIDVAIAIVWVVFAINFFWTLARRAEKHMYVAVWFYIATIITVAVLHIFNSLAIPVFALKSYSIYGGAKDALVQWWYGHNAVAFFLTTPVLGIMYYFVPKAAERPVYSYRLSVVHFWALVFLYIWAGPHHLLNTALPDWAQTLGMIFSVMLWAPSWGGMLNGLLTLRGAWNKLRTEPVLKFYAAAVTFYGMSTFEGPLLSVKAVNSLAHYTDWIVGHAHSGALGWNGFMAAGMFYWLIPRLYGRELYSKKAAEAHFYIGTFGMLLYVVALWIAGVTQGLMWRQYNPNGELTYKFVETVAAILPLYWMRLIGGSLYLIGMIVMAWNLVMTVRGAKAVKTEVEVTVPKPHAEPGWASLLFGRPVVLSVVVLALAVVVALVRDAASFAFMLTAAAIAVFGGIAIALANQGDKSKPTWHRLIEGRALVFTVLTLLGVLAGGVAELIPVVVIEPNAVADARPTYRPLELEGRDVYIREGCYTCHSQQIRPFKWEADRYGDPSTLADSQYDHPFQWGSKRNGPDLGREGVRNPSASWHYKHFKDPRSVTEGSNMPPYAFFADAKVDLSLTQAKVRAQRAVGVPYTQADVDGARADAEAQGREIADELAKDGLVAAPDSEMVAVIAYLKRLGKPLEKAAPAGPEVSENRSGGAKTSGAVLTNVH
jgi:cytochrome c oxidase cbb3-type subunit I/II